MTIETELPAVKVRELEWQPDGDRKYRAKSAIGPYIICPGTGFFYNLAGPVGGRLSTHKRLDDAFLAAQADYERRILSALVPPTNAESRCEELVKALERIVDRSDNGELGTSKVQDMKRIATAALKELGKGDGR